MDIQFNPEDKNFNTSHHAVYKPSKMVGWVLKTGIAKDEQRATYVLMGISIISFILTIVVIVK